MTTDRGGSAADTLYARLGGEEFFVALVESFYSAVEADTLLRPLYPEDLGPAKAHLGAFLVQYFGGPRRYEETRGEPRLRMRHLRFRIDRGVRGAWVACMDGAIAESGADEQAAEQLRGYFHDTATFLINTGGLAFGGGPA